MSLLREAGMECMNPIGAPTHASGSSIDTFVSERDCVFPSVNVGAVGAVGQSDHALLHIQVQLEVSSSVTAGFGRIVWASGEEWDRGLSNIDSHLACLAAAVEGITSHPEVCSISVHCSQTGDAEFWMQ